MSDLDRLEKMMDKFIEKNNLKEECVGDKLTKENKKHLDEQYKELTNDARCAVILTDNGVSMMGAEHQILASVSTMLHSLKNKVNVDQLRTACELGLADEEKMADMMAEKLAEIMTRSLGDE